MKACHETLLRAASAAPSGDNTQPWRFGINADGTLVEIEVDPARDPSLMNANQRMARIAVGAAAENFLRTAACNGWDAELLPPSSVNAVAIRITASLRTEGDIDRVLLRRVTNRRYYNGSSLSASTLAALQRKTPDIEGVRTHWIVDRRRLVALARMIGRADAVLFGHPLLRRAIFENVRFDLPTNAAAEEGLPVGSLALPLIDRLAFRGLRATPDWLLAVSRIIRVFAAKATQLVNSASGICVVTANTRDLETDFQVGRSMQQAWLAATQLGLAVQPMMSLCVLDNVLENAPEFLGEADRSMVRTLQAEMSGLVPEMASARAAAILRAGFAAEPFARSGRLPLTRLLKYPQADLASVLG